MSRRAEISYSKTIPAKFPFGQRSFLKATFFDHEKQLLVSKSVLRDDMPAVGGSCCVKSPALQHCYAQWLAAVTFDHVGTCTQLAARVSGIIL